MLYCFSRIAICAGTLASFMGRCAPAVAQTQAPSSDHCTQQQLPSLTPAEQAACAVELARKAQEAANAALATAQKANAANGQAAQRSGQAAEQAAAAAQDAADAATEAASTARSAANLASQAATMTKKAQNLIPDSAVPAGDCAVTPLCTQGVGIHAVIAATRNDLGT